MLDLDQLRTFVAIAEYGSFTRAAEMVHKTQSAVSMQMRRLEERIGRPIFMREGRLSRLTEEGEKLLHYARRLVQLNDETLAAFDETEVQGMVRLGTPDDYADRFLPEILARFSRSNPKAEVSVVCAPTANLIDLVVANELDVAIITHVEKPGGQRDEVIRREPLLWVTSARHAVENEDVLPLALGRATCGWRRAALLALRSVGREHRLLYSSWNSTAVGAAVLAGLAVSVLPESALRPGMRVLAEADGFPKLPECEIAVMRSWHQHSRVTEALVEHIISSLDNLSVPQAAE
ncbi:LysR substrate-binding domain-containing protein [Pannonibacter sp. Q-1]|uniref:LysR family transcriptional regulator n=1 Tax=Pannonibacter phragmitetus TaxID=121719 RepID=A0A0L0J398_9HYPH|nr:MULTISPECIES: LysR substrate-binding domain-containing protein [Pannonibacter]ALV25935.1 LysR family transcriptional regulator [Pannonibacter phragmitetus]KND20068.1 LysR family transcriptional regulator [Pannonibacter phragmitetus]MBA4206558.1 transcriptional regulator LrhA [Polymorphum sp.]